MADMWNSEVTFAQQTKPTPNPWLRRSSWPILERGGGRERKRIKIIDTITSNGTSRSSLCLML